MFHAGLSALVQGLRARQPQRFAGFGQLDPTQEIQLGSVALKHAATAQIILINIQNAIGLGTQSYGSGSAADYLSERGIK